MVIGFIFGVVVGGAIAVVAMVLLAYTDDREEKVDMGRGEY